jgi:hypothetical protein
MEAKSEAAAATTAATVSDAAAQNVAAKPGGGKQKFTKKRGRQQQTGGATDPLDSSTRKIDNVCSEICALPCESAGGAPATAVLGSSQRYFTGLVLRGLMKHEGSDQVLNTHPNGIVVVCLAPSHAVNTSTAAPVRVTFAKQGDRSMAGPVPSGKRKAGALSLAACTVVCEIELADGSKHPVYASVAGDLLEVNERLMTEPELLCSAPLGCGYIAVMKPKPAETESIQRHINRLGVNTLQESAPDGEDG